MPQSMNDKTIAIAADVLNVWGRWANAKMRKLLRERTKGGKFKEPQLMSSLVFDGSDVTKDGARIEWNLDDYWVYIDLGVKGLRNRSKTYTSKDNPSGFQFRSMATPPQMINAMQSYIARYGIQVRTSKTQSKQSIQELSFQKATAMSKAVKKKGITGTRFYSDVFNDEGFKKLTDLLEKRLGGEIEITIVTELKK